MSILDDLKDIFLSERSSPSDRVPRALLEEFASIPRLTGVLPYHSWLGTERLFVLDQTAYGEKKPKNLGFCIEVFPQTGSTEEMERVLSSLFVSCPPDTGIQITMYASPDILPVLRRQALRSPVSAEKDGLRSVSIYRQLSRRRIDFYLNKRGKPIFSSYPYSLRDFRCVLSFTLPLDPERPSDIEEALSIRESIHSILRSAMLPGFDWLPDDLINFVADFFDHERAVGTRTTQLEYDESELIRDQISNTEIASVVADNFIKARKSGERETALQCYSVTKYPRYFRLHSMEAMIGDYYRMALSIPCPFLITMGAVVQDFEAAQTSAQLKATRATQAATSKLSNFQPDLQDRKKDWDMVLRAFSNGRNVVRMYHQVVLISDLKDASRCGNMVRSVWQARGVNLTKDYYLQNQALTAALPCTLTQGLQDDLKLFGRVGTKTADNAVMTSPLLAEWKGTQTPILTLFGRRGQIMSLDLFDSTGNYNFTVTATSGSGKSVLVNEIAFRYLADGAKVWVIDVGRSYKNLCLLLDGEFIEFTDESDNKLCLNPFSMVIDINNDMEMLRPIIARMASPQEKLTNYSHSLLESAIKHVWDEKGKQATITDIHSYLLREESDTDVENVRDMRRLAKSLEPYTKYGVYASYFEGKSNIKFDSNFVVLELEELKSKKNLQGIVLMIMMYQITQIMYFDRSNKKLVILDEAWDLIDDESSETAKFIEAGYRRARKYQGSFGSIAQSVDVYYRNESTRAMIDNADWMFMLRQKPEAIERLGKEDKIMMDESTRRQLSSLNTEHGLYSEVYVHCPMGSAIGRLILDPFSMLLYSTLPQDFEAVAMLTRQGIPVGDAIEMLLQERQSQERLTLA